MTAPVFIPSTPDPQVVTLVASVLRWQFTLLSAAGVTWAATTSSSTISALAAAIVGLVGAAATLTWSLWQKYQAAKADHDGSVRSAATNIATKAI